MGRLIIKFKDNHLESFKCKSKERAKEIAEKRPKVKNWDYYDDNDSIPRPIKKETKDQMPMTLEELECYLKTNNVLY